MKITKPDGYIELLDSHCLCAPDKNGDDHNCTVKTTSWTRFCFTGMTPSAWERQNKPFKVFELATDVKTVESFGILRPL